jgi:hypothetical protein
MSNLWCRNSAGAVREPRGIRDCGGEEGGGEKEDGKPEVVPKFAETHEALMKVKSFFYAHSTSDSDRESVLGLEKSYFELRSKVCT